MAFTYEQKKTMLNKHLSLPHLSKYDSFSYHAEQMKKNGFFFRLFTSNSDDREKIKKLGQEADKVYSKPASKDNMSYLIRIYKEAKNKANSYVSKHNSPSTKEGQRLYNEANKISEVVSLENAIIESKINRKIDLSQLSIQDILFDTDASHSTDGISKDQPENEEHSGKSDSTAQAKENKKISSPNKRSNENFINGYTDLISLFDDIEVIVKSTLDNREMLEAIYTIKSILNLTGTIIPWKLFLDKLDTIDYLTSRYEDYDLTEKNFFKQVNDICSSYGILKRAVYYYQESNKVTLEREETLNDLFSPQRLLEQQELWDNE